MKETMTLKQALQACEDGMACGYVVEVTPDEKGEYHVKVSGISVIHVDIVCAECGVNVLKDYERYACTPCRKKAATRGGVFERA